MVKNAKNRQTESQVLRIQVLKIEVSRKNKKHLNRILLTRINLININKISNTIKKINTSKNINSRARSKHLRLKSFKNPELILKIEKEIIDKSPGVNFESIEGLNDAKRVLRETIIYPQLKPELFKGLRQPPRGIFLFGPPGNGKIMLAKAVASGCNMTFYNISSSTMTYKYHGEGKKLVRAFFESTRSKQSVVIFMDELGSLLNKRSSQEHEASTRLKTEFLVQFDGVISQKEKNNILIMGATNRPEELNEAVLRSFAKKIYIELPNVEARKLLIKK